MNNFLEKFTLYDWFGYMMPGTLCVVMFGWCFYDNRILDILSNDIFKEYKLYIVLGILVVGYIVGIVLTQIGDFVYNTCIVRLCGNITKKIGYDKIGYGKIKEALVKSKVIESNTTIATDKDVDNYMGYIYGDIQTDAKYTRIHNYASMELICKNLSISILAGWGMWLLGREQNFRMTLVALATVAVLFCRWKFFYQRKHFYAAAWFTQSQLSK